jgi:uncharacterized protein
MFRDKWYKQGLRFTCTECGNCCTGAPGYVWLTQEEIRRIADFLDRDDGWLPADSLRRVGFRYSLTEKSNGDCVFLQSNGDGRRICSIYTVRPLQCRTWPFWSSNLKSPGDWAAAGETCPGMNNGKHHDYVQIETIRTKKSW